MKILLGINLEPLEVYIKKLDTVDVCGIVRNKKSLLEKALQYEPEVIMVSQALAGDENMIEVMTQLTSKNFPSSRIIYLYGEDDSERKEFINFIITRGIYDYFVGDELKPEIINALLFNPKSRDDVKKDIINIKAPAAPDKEAPLVMESRTDKIRFVQEVVKELSEQEKKDLGLLETREVSSTVIADRIIGGVTIAVAGTGNCVGCTHTAFQIANFLARHAKRFKVAVLQLNDKRDFQVLKSYGLDKALNDNSFRYKRVDYYYDTTLYELKLLKHYDYYILDLGRIRYIENGMMTLSKHYESMLLADLSILVCSSKPWQFNDIATTLFKDDTTTGFIENRIMSDFFKTPVYDYSNTKDWRLFFTLADDDFFKEIKPKLSAYWHIFKSVYSPDLFTAYPDLDNILKELIQPVLPKSDRVIRHMNPFSFLGFKGGKK